MNTPRRCAWCQEGVYENAGCFAPICTYCFLVWLDYAKQRKKYLTTDSATPEQIKQVITESYTLRLSNELDLSGVN